MASPEPRRVLVAPGRVLEGPWEVLTLPDARHGTRQVLLSGQRLHELTRVQRPLGAWLVGESLEGAQAFFVLFFTQPQRAGDGGVLHIATPMDPLYTVLPLLERSAERFRPFSDLVGESDAAYAAVAPLVGPLLATVCELKQIPGLDTGNTCAQLLPRPLTPRHTEVLRLDRTKCFRWLLCKVDNVLRAVEAGQAGRSALGTLAVSRTLNVAEPAPAAAQGAVVGDPMAALRTAVDVVADYVSPQWASCLRKHYGIAETSSFASRFAEQNRTTNGARFVEPMTGGAAPKSAPKPEVTAGQKRLRKVDTKGMATLSNFFPKRPKPQDDDGDKVK